MPAQAIDSKTIGLAGALLLAVLLACNSSGSRPPEEPEPPPSRVGPGQPISTQEYTPTPAPKSEAQGADPSGDAPEISRSAGVAGGVVVLFPRIVLPRSAGKPDTETRVLAGRAQARLADLVKKAMPGKPVDIRPEPERVCPKTGCKGISVGLLFAKAGGGCSLFALVSGPGTSPQRIIQWSPGLVRLSSPTVAFRSPPESVVKVDDYGSCQKLPEDLAGHDGEVEAAIKSAAGS